MEEGTGIQLAYPSSLGKSSIIFLLFRISCTGYDLCYNESNHATLQAQPKPD